MCRRRIRHAVPDVSGSVVWTQDATAFYVRVFAEADPGLFISVGRHASGQCRFNCRQGQVKEPDFRSFVIVRRNVAETK
jgi:hypothetical protein